MFPKGSGNVPKKNNHEGNLATFQGHDIFLFPVGRTYEYVDLDISYFFFLFSYKSGVYTILLF